MENHVNYLDGSTIQWLIRVRVTRMWLTTNTEGVILRHNLLLLDCEVILYEIIVTLLLHK